MSLRAAGRAALPVAVVAVDLLLFSSLLSVDGPSGAVRILILGYALVGAGVLYGRQRWPALAYAALWIHAAAAVARAGYRPTLPLLVVLATVAARRPARVAVPALLAVLVPVGLAVADGVREAAPEERTATAVGLSTLLIIIHCGVWAVGRWAGASRRRAGELETQARDAARAERTRLAAELHDIVAHSVVVMTLQAAGAKAFMRRDPDRAEQALTEVGDTGTQTIAELRRMLAAKGGPEHGLSDLDELIGRVRGIGVDVTLHREGGAAWLDPDAELAAYRVIQEALTNVAKHAGPGARATVLVRWEPDSVRVEVSDDGGGEAVDAVRSLSTGNGLRGLAERVSAAGGRLESGSMPAASGFRVAATLPLAVRAL